MTGVTFAYEVDCTPERVKELLLNEAFLLAFADKQRATETTVSVDRDRQASTLSWTIRLDGDLPGIVTRFVGRTARLHLVFNLGDSKLDMTAKANRRGTLACDFRVEAPGPTTADSTADSADRGTDRQQGSVLHLDGRLSVSGFLGSLAETTVRDEVIKPVFEKDLVPLLKEWCPQNPGKGDVAES
jgi:hypothetical protein